MNPGATTTLKASMTAAARSQTTPRSARLALGVLPLIAGAMLLAVPSSSPQAQGAVQTPQPGYWEYTTRAVGQTDTETRCVRPSEIERFFNGLSTRRYDCTYPTKVVGNGQARFEGTCVSRGRSGRRLRVRLTGPYSADSFSFDGAVSMRIGGGIWTPYIPGSVRARRISATCPAGAEYF